MDADIHVGDLVVINSDPSVIGLLFDQRITLPANSVGNVDGLQDRVSVAPADRAGLLIEWSWVSNLQLLESALHSSEKRKVAASQSSHLEKRDRGDLKSSTTQF